MDGGRVMLGDDRGQTALDFAVAMGVFLIALAFVLAFIPSMFAPFFDTGGGNELRADRAAATLVEDELVVEPGTQALLSATKVENFFDGCTDEDLADVVGLPTQSSFVEIVDENGDVIESGGITLNCGDESVDQETVSSRLVSIDGEPFRLRVVIG